MILNASSEGKFTSKVTEIAVTFNILEVLISGCAGVPGTRGDIDPVDVSECEQLRIFSELFSV